MITHAFTCTGPYAILILLGIKKIENRSMMPTPSKGRCAITCSKSFNRAEYGNFVQWASQNLPPQDFERIPAWIDVKDWPGKVVGACDYSARGRNDLVLEDGTARPESAPYRVDWDEGYDYWWDLSEVVCFDEPIPCRGNVGMWELPQELAIAVSAADRQAQAVGVKIARVEDAAELFYEAVSIAGGSEGFFVLPLDDKRRTLAAPILVSLGTDAVTTVVGPREVFAEALKLDAKSIIVAHNHPSGDITPSLQDRELTAALKRLGEILDIRLLDHLVIGNHRFAKISA